MVTPSPLLETLTNTARTKVHAACIGDGVFGRVINWQEDRFCGNLH